MAELKTKKGNIVKCNILNESLNSYLIEYNGKVGQVRKDRIVSLDEIDEAVLEGIGERIKSAFGKLKNFIARIFLVKNKDQGIYQVRVGNEDTGKVYQVSMPVQAAMAAAQGKNQTIVAYDGPRSDYQFARELGIAIDAVPHNADNKTIEDGLKDARKEMKESVNVTPRRSALTEADARAKAAKYHYVPLEMVGDKDVKTSSDQVKNNEMFASSYTIKEAVEEIYQMYRTQRGGMRKSQGICLWGAPGIGKSSMKDLILHRIQERFPDVRWIEISGRGNTDDLYMQVKTTVSFKGRHGEGREKNAVSLENIANLPMYNANNLSEEEVLDNEFYANGGRWKGNEQVSVDNGGIIFIDEFSRSTESMMNTLMTLLSDQTIGGGMRLGNRWIVITAANTKSQMRGLDAAEAFFLDPAQQSRIKNLNIVPTAEEWYETFSQRFKTYTSEFDGKTYTFSEVEPEILEFVLTADNKKWFYNLQIVDRDEEEYVNQYASKAIPRTWNNASEDIRFAIIIYNEDHGTDYTTLTDFWNATDDKGKNVGQDIIFNKLKLAVGIPAAEAFKKFMTEKTFNKKEAVEVWKTGKCDIMDKVSVFTRTNTIIPALVTYNPGLANISNNNNATIAELVDPEQLINVMNYLYELIKHNTPGGAAVTVFLNEFGLFQQACIRNLRTRKNANDEFNKFANIQVNPEDRDLVHYFASLGEQLEQDGSDPVLLKKIIRFCEAYEAKAEINSKSYH